MKNIMVKEKRKREKEHWNQKLKIWLKLFNKQDLYKISPQGFNYLAKFILCILGDEF